MNYFKQLLLFFLVFISAQVMAADITQAAALVDKLADWVIYALAVVGGASLIVQGLARIARLTPSRRDDYYLEGAAKFFAWLTAVLDKVALNLPASKARRE